MNSSRDKVLFSYRFLDKDGKFFARDWTGVHHHKHRLGKSAKPELALQLWRELHIILGNAKCLIVIMNGVIKTHFRPQYLTQRHETSAADVSHHGV